MRPSETSVPRAPLDLLYRVPVEESGPSLPLGKKGEFLIKTLSPSPPLSLAGKGVYWMKTT